MRYGHVCAVVSLCVSCSASETSDPARDPRGDSGSGGSLVVSVGTGGNAGSGLQVPAGGAEALAGAAGIGIITSLPKDFVATEIGGYKLGDALVGAGGAGGSSASAGTTNCGNVLLGVVRDFRGRSEPSVHPDFEGPLYGNDITIGLVDTFLGSDRKPVYASQCEEGKASPPPTCPFNAETTTQANFEQWYRYVAEANKPYALQFFFAPQANGLFTFQSLSFFPLDNAGFGNSGVDKQGQTHNFSFTTEIHTKFQYKGRETFTFEGDDDVWIFINRRLAVDLGGLHPKAVKAVKLDDVAAELGITVGNVYDLELFHAERHTPESTFRIDSNLAFVDCGTLPPDVVK